MKSDSRHNTGFGHWLRFGIRALGLTGLLALGAGLMLTPETGWNKDALLASAKGNSGMFAHVVSVMVLAGGALVALLLLLEVLGLAFQSAGRKTAEGTNAGLQIILALGFLFVVNAVSFRHYDRKDLTRDHRFSIDPELQERLKKLNPEKPTKVVVLQRHKTSDIESDNPGALEAAAQAKVVEKVRDVVDELRELGPRFQVSVLDTRDEDFDVKLNGLTEEIKPATGETPDQAEKRENENRERRLLKDAIEEAPENSVFFAANGRIQRLGFNQFYLLDKTASVSKGQPEHRNLVLVPQGKAAFIEKVLQLEERTPKIGVLTIHPLLTTELDNDDYSASGLRLALEEQGYEVTDVLLKRWAGRGTPPAAADSFTEKKLTTLERALPVAQLAVARYERQAEVVGKALQLMKTGTYDEINRKLRGLPRPIATETERAAYIENLSEQEFSFKELAKEKRAELAKSEAEYYELLKDDRAVESLRNQDVKSKLRSYVRDCDLLIIPRLTTMQLANRAAVPGWLHSMNKDQAEVIREFMAAGKPVMFAMGPVAADPPEPNETANDDIEKMIARLGIDLGADTIITDAELKATPESDDPFAVPPDIKQLKTALEFPYAPLPGKAANPIAQAYRAAAHSVDADLDSNKAVDQETGKKKRKLTDKKRVVFMVNRIGGYRSIVVTPPVLAGLPFSPEILHTVEKSWNELKPLKDDTYTPSYDPRKPDDPKKGGREDEVMKPYSVGSAIEVPVPAEWNDPKVEVAKYFSDAMASAPGLIGLPPGIATAAAVTPDALGKPSGKTVRAVVYGHGGLFIGKELDPGRQTLLLDSVNWLLGRTDRMPVDKPEMDKWRYPRVTLAPEQWNLWDKATRYGLPALAIYFCFMVLMVRRFR
jgi:hypothetical protein